jgi:hypothetical protein
MQNTGGDGAASAAHMSSPGYHLFRFSHLFGVSLVRGLICPWSHLSGTSLVRGSLPVQDSGDSFLTFPFLFRSPVASISPSSSGANLLANSVFLLFTPLPFLPFLSFPFHSRFPALFNGDPRYSPPKS